VGSRLAPGFKSLMALAGCALALQVSTLLAQDENAAPPAPADNGAPAQGADQATGAVAQDDGSGGQDQGASFQTFYDNLANQGTWIQSNDYGYVWQPQVSDPNWAPYTAGHWVYTDDGWAWVSDESWGWATYHYGRWVNIDGTGWVWVPGYTWGPAWVSWRYGDGYVGWAPLPPDSLAGVDYSGDDTSMDVGYHIGGDCDDYYGIGPAYYIFLPWNFLCYRDYHGHYCNRGDNFWRINHTTNVTNINVGGNKGGFGGQFRRVSAGGPQVAEVNAVSEAEHRAHKPTGRRDTDGELAGILRAAHQRGHEGATGADRRKHRAGEDQPGCGYHAAAVGECTRGFAGGDARADRAGARRQEPGTRGREGDDG